MFGLSYLKKQWRLEQFLTYEKVMFCVLLLFSFNHESACVLPATIGKILSFSCLGKDKASISKTENNFFSRSSVDYKTLQDFTRKQCNLKSGVQANTHRQAYSTCHHHNQCNIQKKHQKLYRMLLTCCFC